MSEPSAAAKVAVRNMDSADMLAIHPDDFGKAEMIIDEAMRPEREAADDIWLRLKMLSTRENTMDVETIYKIKEVLVKYEAARKGGGK